MRLRRYITELSFKSDADVKIIKDQAWLFQTEFDVKGAAKGAAAEKAMGSAITYVVSCQIHGFKEVSESWEVSFFPRYDARPVESSLEHGKQVFAGVYKSIKLLIQKKVPTVFWFHAATPRLDKVYNKLAPLMSKNLRGYKYVKHSSKYVFYRPDQQHKFNVEKWADDTWNADIRTRM